MVRLSRRPRKPRRSRAGLSWSRALVLLWLLALCAAPRVGRAQPMQADESVQDLVRLRDYRPAPGCSDVTAPGFYRGRVVALLPGLALRWVSPSGLLCQIPWRQILSARGFAFRGRHQDPLPPELVSPSMVRVPAFDRYHLVQLPLDEDLQQANLAPGPGRQPLRIEAQGQPVKLTVPAQLGLVRFQDQRAHVTMGTTLCDAPCTLYQPPGPFAVRSEGAGSVLVVHEVNLPERPGGHLLRLRRSSERGLLAGQVLTVGGGLLALIGGGALGLSALINSPTLASARSASQIGGGVVLGVGLAALVPGILLWQRSRPGVAEVLPL